MDLRTKTLVVFGIGLIVTLACFSAYSSFILRQSYENIEIKEVRGDIGQVEFALDNELSNLDSTLKDWAEWDDTYNFTEGMNPAYINDNFQKNTFTTLDLNFVFIFNQSEGLVFAEAYNQTTDALEPVSPLLQDTIVRNYPLYPSGSPGSDSPVKGIFFIDRQPVAVSVRPVLKSNGEGPAAGIFIMGRDIDYSRIGTISKITGSSVMFIDPLTSQDDPQLQPVRAGFTEGNTDVILPVNQNTIAAYIPENELNITPARYFIKITEPRIIYESGISTLYAFVLIGIIAAFVFGSLGLFLIDRMVLSRVSVITNDVRAVGSGKAEPRITEVPGDDELTQLSRSINRMLGEVSRTRERYKSIVEDQSEFICRFGRDGIVTFMNPAFRNNIGTIKTDPGPVSVLDMFQQAVSAETFENLPNSLTVENPIIPGEHKYRLEAEDRFITWTIRGIFDRDENLSEYQFVGRDITAQKHAEAALQQVTRKLSLLNYVTFNDIRNAVFTLRGYLSLGKNYPGDKPVRYYFDRSEESVRRIEDSLAFAQQYQGLGMDTPQWQSVNNAFILGISHLDFSSIQRSIKLDNLEIYADPLLERVFFTLAGNVLRHAKTATEITVGYEQVPDGTQVVIPGQRHGDTGCK